MLAALFLLTIWSDASQPTYAPTETYLLLCGYVLFAAVITIATWNSWWRDARLSGFAHAVDILMFALLVLLTDGYTSPFFAFFMFILLSAAIRWDWDATALTAIFLTMVFLLVGLVATWSGVPFELSRFVVRTGQLVVLSIILIWFGARQSWTHGDIGEALSIGHSTLDESPHEAVLRATVDRFGAKSGFIVWREGERKWPAGLSLDADGMRLIDIPEELEQDLVLPGAILYDLDRGRALRIDSQRDLRHLELATAMPQFLINSKFLTTGIAFPITATSGEGLICLDDVPGLCLNHLDLADKVAEGIANHLQRHAVLKNAEERAESRSRLALARDLHDSVVQFIAGAAYRIEATKRSHMMGRNIQADLDELKQLMMQEQRELRAFITALRSGPMTAIAELGSDLAALAERLSRQWDIDCTIITSVGEQAIPTRLRLDANQIVRESVANAVRHAGAKTVGIDLSATSDSVTLEIVNDGTEFPRRQNMLELPLSLRERVEQAGGAIDIARGMGVTKLSFALPIDQGGAG
ncbi:sensor histidine kinase [Sphingomonas xanthus]|uniref:Signal transduction histidine kinase subgroup 3 dimerisation and phosphoacceptor domain-containing protein n=1 Tax=Sphingomonas xanthus TaxID=2594473 RepID=A0A516ITM8_9SPHN|nr:histidine kinase [Sphingomonas xanthus]QDP20247.1 hypothetical protein FMM02_09960 [Sphingomonas xanthus]